MTPVCHALLLVLAGPSPAQINVSQDAGPGTKEPHNRNCGLPATATPDQMRALIEDSFYEAVHLAMQYYADPANADPNFADPERRNPDKFAPFEKLTVWPEFDPDLDGPGPGFANGPTEDQLKRGVPGTVTIKPLICEIASGQEELVLTAAHEIAHLAMRHPDDYNRVQEMVRPRCGADQACYDAAISHISPFLEQEADGRGEDYLAMSKGKYDLRRAMEAFNHVRDWYYAKGLDLIVFPSHPPPVQRREEGLERAERLRKAMEGGGP